MSSFRPDDPNLGDFAQELQFAQLKQQALQEQMRQQEDVIWQQKQMLSFSKSSFGPGSAQDSYIMEKYL
jgi:hypothetical protein